MSLTEVEDTFDVRVHVPSLALAAGAWDDGAGVRGQWCSVNVTVWRDSGEGARERTTHLVQDAVRALLQRYDLVLQRRTTASTPEDIGAKRHSERPVVQPAAKRSRFV